MATKNESEKTIDELLHTPGHRDKYDLRFTAEDKVCLWHEYLPVPAIIDAASLREAAEQMHENVRAYHARAKGA